MSLSSGIFGFIILLNITFAMVVIFQGRRDIGSTWAWLLVLLLIPIAGFILYLFLAQNFRRKKLFYWEEYKKSGLDRGLKSQVSQFRSQQFEFRNSISEEYQDLITMNLLNNQAFLTEDNKVEIITDGHQKFETLFRDIEAATDFIHIQYYIMRKDKLGRKLMDLLSKKAREGVRVRVLYDELGSRGIGKRFLKELRESGGQAEAFFPSKFRLINLRLNYRNHRKLVIIDGKVGYIGGFNVGDEYLGLDPKFGYWRDTHLRLQGTAVYSIQTRFVLDWNQASQEHDITYFPSLFPEVPEGGLVGMQIVSSGPDSEYEHIKNGYLKMITSARDSIFIQTPYFIPDPSMLDALRVACLSGVEVNIMIPDKPDHMFVYWATLSYIGELLKAGANVYQYNNGFVHAKTLVVDDKVASVGTANIDYRSFRLNFEVNAFIYDETIACRLNDEFRKDLEVSTLLTLDKYHALSKWVRLKEAISRLLSPIL
ncbi:cardiolipin synthase [Paenibacillus sp. F411]|uniref:Cardiolipin synthase n=1 Tax=Paenibacillus algicola TaxID=2565926 RepID=A0A4P8XJN9_9BACL|nr:MULTISPECIES: cardiolipin synthase [Paenibacillus]MBO2942927.1 cardiolipin synthase [Paenibacillus sp. F411]QCT02872.1 phospholipase D/Transphosphatidylase [Paenibacillus algicola]